VSVIITFPLNQEFLNLTLTLTAHTGRQDSLNLIHRDTILYHRFWSGRWSVSILVIRFEERDMKDGMDPTIRGRKFQPSCVIRAGDHTQDLEGSNELGMEFLLPNLESQVTG
jgi:hypothetical protein